MVEASACAQAATSPGSGGAGSRSAHPAGHGRGLPLVFAAALRMAQAAAVSRTPPAHRLVSSGTAIRKPSPEALGMSASSATSAPCQRPLSSTAPLKAAAASGVASSGSGSASPACTSTTGACASHGVGR